MLSRFVKAIKFLWPYRAQICSAARSVYRFFMVKKK